jgi:hypothetical protein
VEKTYLSKKLLTPLMHSWETHRLGKTQTSAVARIQDKTVHCVLFLSVPLVQAVAKSLFFSILMEIESGNGGSHDKASSFIR